MDSPAKQLNATLLFTVARDFPRIVNILDLKETHEFLSDCASVIIRAAAQYRGSLANVSGDELHIVFGEPAAEFDNPRHAIKCALAIQNTSDEISVKWRHALDFLVEIDVGISTGPILIFTPRLEYLRLIQKPKAEDLEQLSRECKRMNEQELFQIERIHLSGTSS